VVGIALLTGGDTTANWALVENLELCTLAHGRFGEKGGVCDGREGQSNSMARPPTRRDPMSIRTIEKRVAFGRTFAFGESDELTPTDASNVATDEQNASLDREQVDRQAVEREENEGMSGHPDLSSTTTRRGLPNARTER
jgi:hypothetical protein